MRYYQILKLLEAKSDYSEHYGARLANLIARYTLRGATPPHGLDTPEKMFEYIKSKDPTPAKTYTPWLVDIVARKPTSQIKPTPIEDLERAPEAIRKYEKLKPNLPTEQKNFFNFKTLMDMIDVVGFEVKKIEQATNEEEQKARKETKIWYEDNEWIVYSPLSKYAAGYWGRDTEWCTTWGYVKGRHPTRSSLFKNYNNKNSQEVNFINKIDNNKSIGTSLDSEDGLFEAETIEGKNLIVGKFVGDFIYKEHPQFIKVFEEVMFPWIHKAKGFSLEFYLKTMNYDYIGKFDREGYAEVRRAKDGKYNFINTRGEPIFKEWWAGVGDFIKGFAQVQRIKGGKWNYINTKGEPISNEWWYQVWNFSQGFARVQRTDGTYNFINTNGETISEKWWKYVWDFSEGVAVVERADGKWNHINTKGELLSEEWWKYVWDFNEGFAIVRRVDGKRNHINTKGKTISKEWWEFVGSFNEGFAEVQRADGKWGWIDTQGKFYKEKPF